MDVNPFEQSDRSRATVLYRYVIEWMENQGDGITYTMLVEMFELPSNMPRHEMISTVSNVVSLVNRRLADAGDWRHLVNVETVGYHIGSPEELRIVSARDERAAHRKLQQASHAAEKTIRHPDATVAERRRAADVAANQSQVSQILGRMRRQNRRIWLPEEVSPVE